MRAVVELVLQGIDRVFQFDSVLCAFLPQQCNLLFDRPM
jgi:hypothetical protein